MVGGAFDGWHLSELWARHREFFGGLEGDVFPLLVRIIDALDDLSIQVHTDDVYAAVHENGSLGKRECWYVLDAKRELTLWSARRRETLRSSGVWRMSESGTR